MTSIIAGWVQAFYIKLSWLVQRRYQKDPNVSLIIQTIKHTICEGCLYYWYFSSLSLVNFCQPPSRWLNHGFKSLCWIQIVCSVIPSVGDVPSSANIQKPFPRAVLAGLFNSPPSLHTHLLVFPTHCQDSIQGLEPKWERNKACNLCAVCVSVLNSSQAPVWTLENILFTTGTNVWQICPILTIWLLSTCKSTQYSPQCSEALDLEAVGAQQTLNSPNWEG